MSAVGALGDVRTISYEMVGTPASMACEITWLHVVPCYIGAGVTRSLLGVDNVYIYLRFGRVVLCFFGLYFIYVASTDCKWLMGFDETARDLKQCLEWVIVYCALILPIVR